MSKVVERSFAMGAVFGTHEVRVLLVDSADGTPIASAASKYPTGTDGVVLDAAEPNLARQNPADYLPALARATHAALTKAKAAKGFAKDRIIGIGIAATGSTIIPVGRDGQPVSADPRFAKDPAAMAWLWRDQTALEEAAEITANARESRQPYLGKCGGAYSAEWFWAKVLRCSRHDAKVFAATHTWMELADFVPYLLTGGDDPVAAKRSLCCAGHKAMYNDQWQGYPGRGFLAALSPALAALRDRLPAKTYTSDEPAGLLSAAMAKKLGLMAGIPVAVGLLDTHAGAVGAGIKPGRLVKILDGQSTDMMVLPVERNIVDIPGLTGIVPHSIVPEMFGMDAGQAAVGDMLDWFVATHAVGKGQSHETLIQEAAKLRAGESGLLALDWHRGNRAVLTDAKLSGMILGLNLHTRPAEMYRACIEAAAFGALTILKRYEQYGMKITEVVVAGELARTHALVPQVYADVLNRPLDVIQNEGVCPMGAAIYGSIVGKAHKKVPAAQKKMVHLKTARFTPHAASATVYDRIFQVYRMVHDALGTQDYRGDLYRIMKDMMAIRDQVRRGK